jgi:PleD family two-component response regulator
MPDGQTVSVGVACWDGEESAENLIGRADAALYEAKRLGRDRLIAA